MSRLFIIGAGFSKALANAPLANDVVRKIYDSTLNYDKEYVQRSAWIADRECFVRVLKYLHESISPQIDYLDRDDRKIINRNFDDFICSINIECICSFLDLHTKHYFVPEAKSGDMKGCPIPFMKNFYVHELEGALRFIVHHMLELLLPENLAPNVSALDKMFDFIKAGDNIVSFNYDLLIEQMLWKKELWNPFDGYGIEFETGGNEDFPETKVQLFKVHGSINWRSPDNFFHPNLELAIDHPFKDKPLFEGLEIEKAKYDKEKFLKYPLYSHVFFPTFLKAPQYVWETELIRKAVNAAKSADEIFVLGYSFPEADPIANMIFTERKKDVLFRVVIWDKNQTNFAKDLTKKITKQFGLNTKNAIYENTRIEEWIESDFEYINYKIDQEKLNDMWALMGLKDGDK